MQPSPFALNWHEFTKPWGFNEIKSTIVNPIQPLKVVAKQLLMGGCEDISPCHSLSKHGTCHLCSLLLVDLWNYHGIIINQQSFGRGILLRYRPQTLHVFHTCVHHGHLLCQFSNSVYHSCHTSGEDKQGDKGRRGTAFRGSSEQADTACYSQGSTGTY